MKRLSALLFALAACSEAPSTTPNLLDEAVATDGTLVGELEPLGVRIARHEVTGLPYVVHAGDNHLAIDDSRRSAVDRARDFLVAYGAVVGIAASERVDSSFVEKSVVEDDTGTAVRLGQVHAGIPVIGGELVVHLDAFGVRAVAGTWVPVGAVATTPAVSAANAVQVALAGRTLAVAGAPALAIVPSGLLQRAGDARLAWGVEVRSPAREQIWVDAITGSVVERYALDAHAKNRQVYSPKYLAATPNLFRVRAEGSAPSGISMVDKLYDFSGFTYDLFKDGFGRDSYDGKGIPMRTVYLVDHNCPNAYWDGITTNYCPGFDLDDVVAHEWGHAYTEHTHGLIYQGQSGALNESYSDIWGETVDLLDHVDGAGGSNNAAPAPAGVRWAVGEDFGTGNGEYELLLRDMWDPERLGYPGKVSSANYACGTGDNGGVHTNSGVPNHAFALLVDGGSYNGQTVAGIGFVKAAHIYFRASTRYQTPTTTFAQHATALEQSCADLVGQPLAGFLGVTSGPITTANCASVSAALAAVEMRQPPSCP